ncbi:hypothetical protein FOA52_000472 [Chlamydomonas sp. UWO 241]|nr:hypothetical protein FOA52_000472 [Chlamydomonas sp. UWO 241]
MTEQLKDEHGRLSNSLAHLERSNAELKAAFAADPSERVFKTALEENIMVIAKQRARIAALEEEVERLECSAASGSLVEDGALTLQVPEAELAAAMVHAPPHAPHAGPSGSGGGDGQAAGAPPGGSADMEIDTSAPGAPPAAAAGAGSDVKYGGSAMQGWRRTMEDAHLAETAVDANTQLFGVFDGHGGAEVAKFCQRYMVAEIKSLKEFDDGATVEDALVRVFHRMDEMLREPQYSVEIEGLKTKEAPEDGEDGDGDGGTMDALDLLKRVFQLKRFMGGDGQSPEAQAAIAGSGAAGAAAAAASAAPKPVTAAETEETMVQAGCTAVVAVKRGNELFVANAGDSRGVMGRAGVAIALSEDHKPAHEIERTRIIAAGGFLSDIGGVCRVNGNLNLSRAIGDLRYKCNTAMHVRDQIITAEPDVRKFTITPEDRFFVLACDGVWDVMSNQDVVDFTEQRLNQGMTPAEISCAMLDACLANDPKEARGVGCDNMTAIVVLLNQTADSDAAAAAPAAAPAESAMSS